MNVSADRPAGRLIKPLVADPEAASRLGDVLRAIAYGPEALHAASAVDSWARMAPSERDTPVLRRRLRDHSPETTLLRLFLLGDAVPERSAAVALSPDVLAAAIGAGMLGGDGDGVRSTVRLGWCDGVLVASDWEGDAIVAPDHVAGVAPASLTLADLTVRAPGVTALDVGTGGGVQALLAGKHARVVLGTDVNRRALALAAIGAALNGTPRAAWREGSLFEPVAGERFELVTVNPPFVISPDVAYVFRDGGGPGDSISHQAVAGSAKALKCGGWATVLCNWIEPSGGDWSQPVRRWLARTGCDGWILRYRSDDPVTYAALWNTQAGRLSEQSMEAALDRWLAYYDRVGIAAIVTGAVVIHRPAEGAGGHVWADDMTMAPDGPAGPQIQRVFAHRARLGNFGLGGKGTDSDLLDAVVVPLDGTVLDQSLVRRAGRYEPSGVSMRQQPGLGMMVEVAPDVLPVVLAFDGQSSIRRLLAERGNQQAAERVLETARRLLALGLVELAE